MALEDRVELSIEDALSGIGRIEDALTQATSTFKVGLADALDLLSTVAIGDVDASKVTTGIDEAVAAADTSPTIEADAAPVTVAIDDAVTSADTSVVPTADASGVTTSIDDAVSASDDQVTIDAVTAGITDEINSAVADADTTVTIEADTTDASSSLQDLSTSADSATSSLGGTAGAAGAVAAAGSLAKGEVGGLGAGLGAIAPEAAIATAGILTVAGTTKALFDAALNSEEAIRRVDRAFGDLAPQIEATHIAGFADDLTTLAQRAGQDDEALRFAAARIGDIGNSSGVAAPKVAETTQQIILLATRAAVLNPQLGEAGAVAERLTTALARGGRFAANFGISLTTAEISARALKDTGKDTATQLTVYEKAAAGAALATERLGTHLKSDIVEGAKGTEISIRAVKQEFQNAFEELGKPILATVVRSLHEGQPILLDVSRVFASLARDVLPLVVAALGAIAGPVHILSDVLQVLFAILRPVVDLIAAIPTPLLSAGVAVFGLSKLLSPLGRVLGDVAFAAADAVSGFSGFGTILAAVNPITVVAVIGLATLVKGITDHAKARAAEKAAIEQATSALKDNTTTVAQAVAQSSDVQKLGQRFVEAGLGSEGLSAAIAGGGASLRAYVKSLVDATDASGGLSKSQKELILDAINEAGAFEAGAHATLTAAVAAGTLSRAQELQAIRQHTTKDGAVDWLLVLQQLKPTIDGNTDSVDKYGNALQVQTSATQTFANASQDMAAKMLTLLVAQGQLTQASLDGNLALHQTKDGATDYAATLKDLNPTLADLATQSAILDSGLGDVSTQFKIAKDAADLYRGAITEILDPTLSAEEANIKFHDSLDKVGTALAASKGSLDLSTKAGREADSALVQITRDGESYVASLIAQGAPQAAVTQAKNDEVGALERLKGQYPALGTVIDGYIAKIQSIPPTTGTDIRITGEKQAIDTITRVKNAFAGLTVGGTIDLNVKTTQHMSGGVIFPGEFGTIAEQQREIAVFDPSGRVTVIPHGQTEQILGGQTGGIDYDRLAAAIAGQVARLRPNDITVNQVHEDPAVQAQAVATRLGAAATR